MIKKKPTRWAPSRRGTNPDFKIRGIQMIFRRNYGIKLDSAEIDTSLTYSENFSHLYDRFVRLKLDKDDY